MSVQSGTFTFALPEDESADQLLIRSSATKEGTYTTDAVVAYEYGTTKTEHDSLDDTKWYKIRFNNSVDAEPGPDSDAVYGGDFSKASPFLAISTGSDGANFASTDDVYSYSSLTTENIAATKVSTALRRGRAIIDLKTSSLGLDRYSKDFDTDVSRKKFNAQLRILKEAEINIALGHVYRSLSDDTVMDIVTGRKSDDIGISVGDTNLSPSTAIAQPEHINFLGRLADRYLSIGISLLATLQPNSIRLRHEDDGVVKSPKFKLPFSGV